MDPREKRDDSDKAKRNESKKELARINNTYSTLFHNEDFYDFTIFTLDLRFDIVP
jgi:hypothetical protein